MANPFAGSNTLGATGASSGIGLDPTSRVTQVLVDLLALAASTGAGTSDFTIQATLDVFTSTWAGTSSAAVLWGNISTAHYSSASYPATGLLTITSPVAGLRLSSTSFAGGLSVVTLQALQEIIG